MENRVYYGEYSLKHWIELLLKGNIILPVYQRYFVWDETKVKTLIDTFKKKQFVPPVTIGAFKNGGINHNLILDGQQRLTSILLAYLGLFPDKTTYKKAIETFANENDDEVEENEELDNILEWNFKSLVEKGNNRQTILENLIPGNYKLIPLAIEEDFLNKTFLGFSYLVPYITDEKEQQKYYSSVFRNINIQGEPLLPQESRASLYFLDKNLADFFKPDFFKSFTLKASGSDTKADFVRYIAMLSQYKMDGGTQRIARGYKQQMEKYYELYIYSVVGEATSSMFKAFPEIFPNRDYKTRFERLAQAITTIEIPKQFTSIIELDIYFFGLIYLILFENKAIFLDDPEILKADIIAKADQFKNDPSHARAPAALKYLKARIDASIEIYENYEIE